MKITFNKYYFSGFILLLLVEILIAKFLITGFIRHTFGDFLAVIVMYCFFKSFLNVKPLYMGLAVLVFSFIIEFLQLFQFLKVINVDDNHMVTIILGSTFHVSDLIAYTLGVLFVLIVESIYENYGKS